MFVLVPERNEVYWNRTTQYILIQRNRVEHCKHPVHARTPCNTEPETENSYKQEVEDVTNKPSEF